jgi:hypothetical protein
MVENTLVPQDQSQPEMLTTATPPVDIPVEDVSRLWTPPPPTPQTTSKSPVLPML